MKTVFITGATGFVGSHAAAMFLAKGWRVKALVRRPSHAGRLPAGVQLVQGGLEDADRYGDALAGCDAIVHSAGIIKARTLQDYRTVNRDGAATLARAACAACPDAIFVHVSSQAAAGPVINARPVREDDLAHPISWYGISKLEGEQAIQQHFKGRWIIVRPSVVYGPGDRGMFEIFALAARGWSPILAGGRRPIQLIAVDDLSKILYTAATRPDLSGRRGFAAGEVVTMGELARELARLRRPPARLLPVPAWVIRIAGVVESVREAITGLSRPFNRDKVLEILQDGWVCDSAPFLRDLGLVSLKPWRTGLVETWDWYLKEGWLPLSFRNQLVPL